MQLLPIFVVYASSLGVHTTFDVPLLPHPAGAAVELAARTASIAA